MFSYSLPGVMYLSFQVKEGREGGKEGRNRKGEPKEEIGKGLEGGRKMKLLSFPTTVVSW